MENNIKFKNYTFEIEKSEKSDDRTFTAIITNEALDRDGEVLLASGLNSKNFKSNPIVLFNHNRDLPIGSATSLRRSGNGWKATAKIAEGVQHADDIYKLIQQGILKGVSIGFMPTENRRPTKEDIKLFGKNINNVISKFELLEFSIVSVGCNQEALITGCKALDLDPTEIFGEGFEDTSIKDIENPVATPIEDIKEETIEELEIDDDTKEKLVEVAEKKNIELKDILKAFAEEYKNELKKNKGMLF